MKQKYYWKLVRRVNGEYFSFLKSPVPSQNVYTLQYSFDSYTHADTSTLGIFVFKTRKATRTFLKFERQFDNKTKFSIFKCEILGEVKTPEVRMYLPEDTRFAKAIKLVTHKQYAYKVVQTDKDNNLRSYNVNAIEPSKETQYSLIYKIGEWKFPVGQSKLFVFRNKEEALQLKNQAIRWNESRGYKLFRCEVKGIIDFVEFPDFVDGFVPNGTKLVDCVKLLEEIL